MEKRNKRNETTDKKNDKIKDRGDLKKADEKLINESDEITQVDLKVDCPDRGDSEYQSERKTPINQKPEKIRVNIVVKKSGQDDSKVKNVPGTGEKEIANKKNYDRDEYRKRVRDKYTLKLKSSANKHSCSNLKKDESKATAVESEICKSAELPKKQLTAGATQTKEKLLNQSSTSSGKTNLDKKPERNCKEEKSSSKPDTNLGKPEKNTTKPERNSERRKPIIKTIVSKSGSVTIYKAVTFVDQKRPPTPLQIKIPEYTMKKQKVSKYTDTSSQKFKTTTVSRASIEEKPVVVRRRVDRKRGIRNRPPSSPDTSCVRNGSPPTEVAKWAPACVDRHTKPYYEAWVNTTLAAISKISKKDKLFYDKQREKILLDFQRALEERPRSRSPELLYKNMADERFTGRIKITQR